MCGIAGFFGEFDPGVLGVMNDAIIHRGPDDSGTWFDLSSRVGLAHRRLSIIDLSTRGQQPMHAMQGELVIVFNGEIYNFQQLRRELERDGFLFRSTSDTEVLLNLYARDGLRCMARLNGIFAFALWDGRTRQLILARDGLGVKPLYVAQTGRGVVFASELKAVLKAPGVSRELDAEAVQSYLTLLYAPAPRTMLTSVRKLLPGYARIFEADGSWRDSRFYSLPYHQPVSPMSADEAIAQAGFFVQQAVQRQMVADVPVGAFLSGGLDSSAIAAFAQQTKGRDPLSCFTIGFRNMRFAREGLADDLPYAHSVAKHLGVSLHVIEVDPATRAELEAMVYQLDEPQPDPAALNTYYITKLAREHGIKVMLSGAGGDDVFSGYRRHTALALERYWSWLPVPLRRQLRRTTRDLPAAIPAARRIGKAFEFADSDSNRRIAGYFQWLDPVQTARLMRHPPERTPADILSESLAELPPRVPPLNRMLYLDSKYFLADHNLNYTDKMGMANGVEVRVPLLDPDLVDFAARVPPQWKQRGMVGKWCFRRAMERYLPHDVIYRPKTGFGVPLREWFASGFDTVLAEYLSPDVIRHRGLFDPAAVQELAQANRAGNVDASYTLFGLGCIEIWARRFLD